MRPSRMRPSRTRKRRFLQDRRLRFRLGPGGSYNRRRRRLEAGRSSTSLRRKAVARLSRFCRRSTRPLMAGEVGLLADTVGAITGEIVGRMGLTREPFVCWLSRAFSWGKPCTAGGLRTIGGRGDRAPASGSTRLGRGRITGLAAFGLAAFGLAGRFRSISSRYLSTASGLAVELSSGSRGAAGVWERAAAGVSLFAGWRGCSESRPLPQ